MTTIVERYNKIKSNISLIKPTKPVNIIAVSKTFPITHIQDLIDQDHSHFGENKVQEAVTKWTNIKKEKKKYKITYDRKTSK